MTIYQDISLSPESCWKMMLTLGCEYFSTQKYQQQLAQFCEHFSSLSQEEQFTLLDMCVLFACLNNPFPLDFLSKIPSFEKYNEWSIQKSPLGLQNTCMVYHIMDFMLENIASYKKQLDSYQKQEYARLCGEIDALSKDQSELLKQYYILYECHDIEDRMYFLYQKIGIKTNEISQSTAMTLTGLSKKIQTLEAQLSLIHSEIQTTQRLIQQNETNKTKYTRQWAAILQVMSALPQKLINGLSTQSLIAEDISFKEETPVLKYGLLELIAFYYPLSESKKLALIELFMSKGAQPLEGIENTQQLSSWSTTPKSIQACFETNRSIGSRYR